jgi:hypothetical protein
MLKKILMLSMLSMCSFGVMAEEKPTDTKKLEFDYQDLQLGDVKHIKIIKDQNIIMPTKELTSDSNPKLIANTLSKLSSYKMVLKDTAPADVAAIENIEKLEKVLQQLDLTNNLYSENKNAQLIDTTQEYFSTECFYKKYSSLKICFDYGFGKVTAIRKSEKKDSNKIAEKEKDAIVEKLKGDGFKKDDEFYIKGEQKFSIGTVENVIETTTTTLPLEEFKKNMVKDLREKNFNSSIVEHLEFLK